ncbi:MAG: FprA family A-type flavoprotein [Clostridiales bacterium]|jgi:flavorubredoxin|nr:FprA family A-type flavoprotein [Clostridiales bacterium]
MTDLIRDGVYYIGVMNPALRIFDIVMYAEYGTTYNSYLIIGNGKKAIIDTVHESFGDEFLKNIQMVTDISEIDYLVINHTEPDHSGSVRKILDLNPNIKIYCTAPAQKYLSGIINREFNCQIVREGETLDLGERILTFHPAPFLHWPDSMFTYDSASKIIFTCDFLGTHFCEPRLYDKYMQYPDKYKIAFKYYYDAIFGPFKPYVLAGLEKLKPLDFTLICPSHGPILESFQKEALESYLEWSSVQEGKKSVIVAYATAYGYTRSLAKAAYDVLIKNGYTAELIDVVTTPLTVTAEKIANCGALLVGSNTINKDATKPVWDILTSIDAINSKAKPAGAFGSYGWSGEAVGMIKERLCDLKFKFIDEGIKVNFKPVDKDFETIREYALKVASAM